MKGMAGLHGSRWTPSVPRSATASKWALLIGSQRKPCNGTWPASQSQSVGLKSVCAGCCALAMGSSRLLAR